MGFMMVRKVKFSAELWPKLRPNFVRQLQLELSPERSRLAERGETGRRVGQVRLEQPLKSHHRFLVEDYRV